MSMRIFIQNVHPALPISSVSNNESMTSLSKVWLRTQTSRPRLPTYRGKGSFSCHRASTHVSHRVQIYVTFHQSTYSLATLYLGQPGLREPFYLFSLNNNFRKPRTAATTCSQTIQLELHAQQLVLSWKFGIFGLISLCFLRGPPFLPS